MLRMILFVCIVLRKREREGSGRDFYSTSFLLHRVILLLCLCLYYLAVVVVTFLYCLLVVCFCHALNHLSGPLKRSRL